MCTFRNYKISLNLLGNLEVEKLVKNFALNRASREV